MVLILLIIEGGQTLPLLWLRCFGFLYWLVSDTFVALDCFPLPPCVVSHVANDGGFLSKVSEDTRKTKICPAEVPIVLRDKVLDGQYPSLSFHHIVSSIQKSCG